jgi:hypothetical protein
VLLQIRLKLDVVLRLCWSKIPPGLNRLEDFTCIEPGNIVDCDAHYNLMLRPSIATVRYWLQELRENCSHL